MMNTQPKRNDERLRDHVNIQTMSLERHLYRLLHRALFDLCEAVCEDPDHYPSSDALRNTLSMALGTGQDAFSATTLQTLDARLDELGYALHIEPSVQTDGMYDTPASALDITLTGIVTTAETIVITEPVNLHEHIAPVPTDNALAGRSALDQMQAFVDAAKDHAYDHYFNVIHAGAKTLFTQHTTGATLPPHLVPKWDDWYPVFAGTLDDVTVLNPFTDSTHRELLRDARRHGFELEWRIRETVASSGIHTDVALHVRGVFYTGAVRTAPRADTDMESEDL